MPKKNIANRKFLWGATVACFLLAIVDMLYLRDVFLDSTDFGLTYSSIIALALATVANISALMWGREEGFGKKGKSFKWSWIVLGLIYFLIRSVSIYKAVNGALNPPEGKEVDIFNTIISQALPIFILTISYVGTGSTLRWTGKQLWDADIYNYLNAQKEFTEKHDEIANNNAALWEIVETLQKYKDNYISLDKKYTEYKSSIRKYEKSTLAKITGKFIAANPGVIDSSDADRVMELVLEERDKENEKIHRS